MSHYFFLKEAIDVLMLAELKHVMRVFEIMLHPKIIIVIIPLLIKISIMYFFQYSINRSIKSCFIQCLYQ